MRPARLEDLLERLRHLEQAAASNPGYEADHDHVSTAAYDAYEKTWLALPGEINARLLPESWLELEAWCQHNNFLFGDYCFPWNPRARSLRTALVQSVLRRAEERLTRPEDAALWSDARMPGFLQRLESYNEDELLATVLALLRPSPLADARGSEAPAVPQIVPQTAKLETLVSENQKRLARFQARALELKAGEGTVSMHVSFEHSLDAGETVLLRLVERDTRRPLAFQVDLRKLEGSVQLAAWQTGERSVLLGPDWIDVGVTAAKWKEMEVAAGTILSVEIHWFSSWESGPGHLTGSGPAYLAGGAPAPAVPRRSRPEPAEKSGVRCVTCGEATAVVFESQFCPACHIAHLPPYRPLAGEQGEKLRQVQEAWSETRCPDCGERRFSQRFSSRFPDDYYCEKCKNGWILRDGQFYGYDAATRAQRSAKGNQWTPLLARLTEEIRLTIQSEALERFVAMSENFDPAALNADLREWLLQVCEELIEWPKGVLVFDSSDQEFKDSLALPAAAAARVKASILGS